MKKSSYENRKVDKRLISLFKKRDRNIVIYAHRYFDSPHAYGELQFRDFYCFIKESLRILTDIKNTNVFIKVHPNSKLDNLTITKEIINSFNVNHFYSLDESVSNLNIIELNPI